MDANYWFDEAPRRAYLTGVVAVTIGEWRDIVSLFWPRYEPMPAWLPGYCVRHGISAPDWPVETPPPPAPRDGDMFLGYPLVVLPHDMAGEG